VNYNAITDTSSKSHAEFVAWLSARTTAALSDARGNSTALESAVKDYWSKATTASLPLDEIENMLGVDEDNIMDLADLSEEDEEIVIAAFEQCTEI